MFTLMEKNMSKNLKIEHLLDSSAIFNDGFNVLNRELNRRIEISKKDENYRGIAISIPTVVLLGITIELGLKALIYKEKSIMIKTHNLKTLYDSLDPDRQKLISEYTCEKNKINKIEFSDKLSKYSIAFVEWRYFFEKDNNVDFAFLNSLNNSVQEEIRKESRALN